PRALLYHPHAHFLVSAGGLSADGQHWQEAKNRKFLVPVRALGLIFAAKFRDGLKAAGLLPQVPAAVWQQKWVVHAQHAGCGQKVLDYLGRYVFRIAITHSRLESLENGQVTFRYRDNGTQQIKRVRLPVAEFVKRFLQHVLPSGLSKVRHYGLDSAACRQRQVAAMALLRTTSMTPSSPDSQLSASPPPACAGEKLLRCPQCRTGRLRWLGRLVSPEALLYCGRVVLLNNIPP